MAVLFQGTEVEDFLEGGVWSANGINNYTHAAYMTLANVRAGVQLNSGVEFQHYALSHLFSSNEFWVGLVFYQNLINSTSKHIVLLAGGTKYIAFGSSASNSGLLRAYKWNGSSWDTIQTAGAGSYAAAKVRYDIYVKLGNPGILRIYKDGLPIMAETPNFSFSGLSNLDQLGLYGNNGSSAATYSEVIVATWNTIGSKLIVRVPDANGTHTEWANDDFSIVDEIIGSNDYATSSTVDQRTSYLLTDFPALVTAEVIENIRAVTTASRDGGGPQNLNHFARISSNDYHGSNKALTIGQGGVFTDFAVSPASSTNWTVAELNATEFGNRSRT